MVEPSHSVQPNIHLWTSNQQLLWLLSWKRDRILRLSIYWWADFFLSSVHICSQMSYRPLPSTIMTVYLCDLRSSARDKQSISTRWETSWLILYVYCVQMRNNFATDNTDTQISWNDKHSPNAFTFIYCLPHSSITIQFILSLSLSLSLCIFCIIKKRAHKMLLHTHTKPMSFPK